MGTQVGLLKDAGTQSVTLAVSDHNTSENKALVRSREARFLAVRSQDRNFAAVGRSIC